MPSLLGLKTGSRKRSDVLTVEDNAKGMNRFKGVSLWQLTRHWCQYTREWTCHGLGKGKKMLTFMGGVKKSRASQDAPLSSFQSRETS